MVSRWLNPSPKKPKTENEFPSHDAVTYPPSSFTTIKKQVGKKKPTREELRGEILSKFKSLKEQRQALIDLQAQLKKITGLLNTYTTAYNTVSRVVALRTYGQQ